MLELCRILEISVNELLAGEQLSNDEYRTKADENMLALMQSPANTKQQSILSILHSIIAELILVLFIAFCVYLNTMQGMQAADYLDIPTLLVISGSIVFMLIATGLCKAFFQIGPICLQLSKNITSQEINQALCAAIVASLTAFFSGALMSIMSIIGTFVSIIPANAGATYAALAIGMLGILYGLTFCLLILPFIAKLCKLKHPCN